MLASKLIRITQTTTSISRLENTYCTLLRSALQNRGFTITISLLLFIASLLLIPSIGTEFMPPSDEGEVRINGEMEVGIHLDIADQQTRRLESLVYPLVPESISSVTTVSATGTRGNATSSGEMRISLVPTSQRQRSNTEIAQALRKEIEGKIPDMTIRVKAPQGQFLLERVLTNAEGITIEVRGFDLTILNNLAHQVERTIADISGITDIEISRKTGIPQQQIHINRAKIADIGLTIRDITEMIETAVAGSRAGEYRVEGDSYRIFVQLADAENRPINDILDLTLGLPNGEQVALRNLVSIESGYGPVSIERKNQQRLVSIKVNVSDRDLGSVAKDIKERLLQIPRPTGYDLLIAGQFEKQQQAFQELMLSLILALLLVYMVLASQYESLRDPLVVMLSVPLAAIGVLFILFATDTTLNLQSAIGCIMLGGIVVNNAILLVDQASTLRQGGMTIQLALIEAGRRRLRPILMTTLTTILALLPLALGIGEGADAQAPLARTVVGGLIGSTLITLVLIPVVYSLFYSDK